MAVQGPFKVAFGEAFPLGAFGRSVEPVRDFDASKPGVPVQARDKESGLPVWVVSVIDADPDAREAAVKVKVPAPVQPVLPETLPGLPFRPGGVRRVDGDPVSERQRPDRVRAASERGACAGGRRRGLVGLVERPVLLVVVGGGWVAVGGCGVTAGPAGSGAVGAAGPVRHWSGVDAAVLELLRDEHAATVTLARSAVEALVASPLPRPVVLVLLAELARTAMHLACDVGEQLAEHPAGDGDGPGGTAAPRPEQAS
jgi:hypothetical protein